MAGCGSHRLLLQVLPPFTINHLLVTGVCCGAIRRRLGACLERTHAGAEEALPPVGLPAHRSDPTTLVHERGYSVEAIGNQLLIDLWDCDPRALNSAETIERAIRKSTAAMGATLVVMQVHEFPVMGITATAILAESHMAISTWPERGYLAVDIATCGDHVNAHAAMSVLRECFTPGDVEVTAIERGIHRG